MLLLLLTLRVKSIFTHVHRKKRKKCEGAMNFQNSVFFVTGKKRKKKRKRESERDAGSAGEFFMFIMFFSTYNGGNKMQT